MKILESEVYTGDLVQGKTKIVDHQQVKAGEDNLIIARRTHEPIISYELFTAVQEYRKQICEESRACYSLVYLNQNPFFFFKLNKIQDASI